MLSLVEPDIRPLEVVDPAEATDLLKLVMGDAFGRQQSAKLWRWKHQFNPAGSSLGYAAYSPAGELIALRPFMRWNLLDDAGAKVQAVRAADTVVHPEWRRGGLFSRLTTMAVEGLADKGIELVFNTPNQRSGPGYQKMGWRLLGHPLVWARPRFSRELFSRSTGQSTTIKGLEPFDGQGVQLAAGAAQAAPLQGIMVLKDAAFLKWRYAQHPDLSYAVVNAFGATAIVREDQRFGRRGVALVDYFVRTRSALDFRCLLKTVRAQTQGAYLITGPLPQGPLRLAAISQAFLPTPWRNVNLAARPISWPQAAKVFQDRALWNLTLGDLESF